MYKFLWGLPNFISLHSASLGVELLGHMVNLCFIFWETAKTFSKEAEPSYIPTNNLRGLQFLHIIYFRYLSLIMVILLGTSTLSLWIWFAFPWGLMMKSIFSSVYWPFLNKYSLKKHLLNYFDHFNRPVFLLLICKSSIL